MPDYNEANAAKLARQPRHVPEVWQNTIDRIAQHRAALMEINERLDRIATVVRGEQGNRVCPVPEGRQVGERKPPSYGGIIGDIDYQLEENENVLGLISSTLARFSGVLE